uniref:Tigger transposable element-derived protein 3 isoform X1 n=2 Tax=Pogona vitticeps TaxID=103695 RepID=A0ABM5GMB0_9SAUR
MRPKGRGPADASPGEKKRGKRVKEEEELLQMNPQGKDDVRASPGKGGEDGLHSPGSGWKPSEAEKGDGETAGEEEEEEQQMDHRSGQGPSAPTFGMCRAPVGEMPHWCLECGKNFGQKAELEKHQLHHAGPCSYICGDCGRSFLEHVALVAGQGRCTAGNAFHAAGCRRRIPPFASSETVVPRKERKELSLQEKVRVLEMLEGPKVSQSELAKRFGVSQPQICRIIKNKERILAEWCKNANPGRKRKLEDKGPPGDAALLQWFQRSCVSTEGMLVQDTAGHPSEGRERPEGDPGRGRPSSFKAKPMRVGWERHSAGKESGEPVGEEPWESTLLPGVMSKYEPPNIYTCGEVGLLFRATPGDLAQERREDQLTVLICSNMDASDKREVLVVGKTPKPFGFPRTGGQESPPAAYKASPKAWMTATIFTEWLWTFNAEMQRQGRSVALCLVPCAAHPPTELSNVRMVFLPLRPSRHHPLEQGVIQSFKCHYRRRMLVRLLAGVKGKASSRLTSKLSEHLSLWDALHLVVQAWSEVCPQTITSCFHAAGFSLTPPFPTPPAELVQALGFQSQEQFQQFALVDDGLACFGDHDGARMAKKGPWASERICTTAKEEEEEEKGETVAKAEGLPLPPCPTQAEVTESLAKLRRYLEWHSVPLATFQAFYNLEDVVHEMLLASRPASRAEGLNQE